MNWKMIVGGSIIMVFMITWISAMVIVSGMTLIEAVIGISVITLVAIGVALFAKGLVDYLYEKYGD